MKITVTPESFKLAQVFTISRGSRTEAKVLTVRLQDGENHGWGECVPYARYDETLESVTAEINGLPDRFDRAALYELLPAGAARNAVDCALWDMEAKASGKRAWELAGLPAPKPEITAYTLSLDTPAKMQEQAAKHAFRPLLKIKLGISENSFKSVFESILISGLLSRIFLVICDSENSFQELGIVETIHNVQSVCEWDLNSIDFMHAFNSC